MATDGKGDVALKVLSSTTGDLLAAFSTDASSTVRQAARRVAEASSVSSWMDFQLIRGRDVLRNSSTLHEALGGERGAVELTALALPVARIEVPYKVMDVCVLPKSGDLILASQGSLLLSQPAPPVVGDDHGESSSIWLWRLSAASGWSLSAAVLLARLFGCVPGALKPSWDCPEDQADLWTAEQIEVGESTGVIPFPAKLKKQQGLRLHAHSEDHAIYSWNQSDYIGGMGFIDRIDLASGQVVSISKVCDVWDLTTDPQDGRIFCTTCYDGTDIMQIEGATVLVPERPDEMYTASHKILANAPGIGFDLCFDSALGGLVASCSRFEKPFCFFAVCRPGSDGLAAASSQPGAQVTEALRSPEEDRTPGNRSSPWSCVKLPSHDGAMAERDLHSEELHLAAHGGCVTYLGPLSKAVHGACLVNLGVSAALEKYLEVTESEEPIDAFAITPDQKLLLVSSAA